MRKWSSVSLSAVPRPSARRICGTLGMLCACALSGAGVSSDGPLARGQVPLRCSPLQGRTELPAGLDEGPLRERLVLVTSAVRESRATIADGFVFRPMLHTSLRACGPAKPS